MDTNRHRKLDPDSADQKGLFSAIAGSYDFLNHLLSFNVDRVWRSRLVRLAGVKPGERILDVCTGTGDIAIRFAQTDGIGEIWGVDQSEEMLSVARRKIAGSPFRRKMRLLQADALRLPFENGTFDVVSVGFGLRNIGQHREGIFEMVRVIKKNGRLLILEFSPPEGSLFGAVYRSYLNTIIRVVGGVVSGSADAYRYLSASIDNFPKPERILELMQAAGLRKLRSERLTGGIAYIYRGDD